MSSATFLNGVQVNGDLSGPTITQINSTATSTLNSLNAQISTHNTFAAQSEQNFINASAARSDLNTAFENADTALQSAIDANEADIEAKHAQEVSDRLALATLVSNNKSATDTSLADLEQKHQEDDARLTSVETALQNVDTDLQSQITAAVNDLNINHQNVEPRTAKLEEYLEIDESDPANPVVKIKQGVRFEVSGDFVQG